MNRLILAFLFVSALTAKSYAGKLEDPDKDYPNIIPPDYTVGSVSSDDLSDPRGVSFDSIGRLFVAEAGANRISIFLPPSSAGNQQYKFSHSIGRFGKAEGDLNGPTDVKVDEDLVYIVDQGNNRIQVFSASGTFVRSWGVFGNSSGSFNSPSAIAIGKTHILVSDTGNNRIQIFDKLGRFVESIGSFGSGDQQFNEPTGIAANPSDGSLYVADTHNNRIHKMQQSIAPGGSRTWGAYGSYPGQFAEPIGLAFGKDELYVADLVNHRIQVFDGSGRFRYTFARHPLEPRQGEGRVHYPIGIGFDSLNDRVAVCESFENRCQVFSSQTVKHSYTNLSDTAWWDKYPRFHYGRRLKITKKELMRVNLGPELMTMSEPDIHRVVVFDVSGDRPVRIADFGGFGDDEHRFKGPHGVGVNTFGEIFVTDSFNHKVKVFNLKGINSHVEKVQQALALLEATGINSADLRAALPTFTPPLERSFGGFGAGPDQFNTPSGGSVTRIPVSANEDDKMWISDTRNHRIKLYNRDGTYAGLTIGGYGSGPGQLKLPTDMVGDHENYILYSVDAFNQRVSAFDSRDGKFLFSFGQQGVDPGQFMAPSGIAVDGKSHVFVTDQGTQRVSRWKPTRDASNKIIGMEFDKWFGDYSADPGGFLYPQGIAIDSRDRLYVINFGMHRGEIFDRDGQHISSFGEEVLQVATAK